MCGLGCTAGREMLGQPLQVLWQDLSGHLTRAALPAESDPDFREKALQQLDKRKKVVVYCGRGGTLRVGNGNERKYNKDDPERMFGIETRSLKACYELLEVRRPRGSNTEIIAVLLTQVSALCKAVASGMPATLQPMVHSDGVG